MPKPCSIEPCPIVSCLGTLHRRGKGRSPACSVCGYCKPLKRGRPRKDPSQVITSLDIYYAKKTGGDRAVTYALFDPALFPEGSRGIIHKTALVGIVVGRSKKSVETDRPGLRAVPLSKLWAKEKLWAEKFRQKELDTAIVTSDNKI